MNDFFVYIIFSEKLNKLYIGYSSDTDERLAYHNESERNKIWTKRGIPWKKFLTIKCDSEKQAINIERHIKKMKSKKYIENLAKYPEMVDKLIQKYVP